MHYPSYVLIFQIFFIIWNMGTPLNSDLGPVHGTTPNIALVFKVI